MKPKLSVNMPNNYFHKSITIIKKFVNTLQSMIQVTVLAWSGLKREYDVPEGRAWVQPKALFMAARFVAAPSRDIYST